MCVPTFLSVPQSCLPSSPLHSLPLTFTPSFHPSAYPFAPSPASPSSLRHFNLSTHLSHLNPTSRKPTHVSLPVFPPSLTASLPSFRPSLTKLSARPKGRCHYNSLDLPMLEWASTTLQLPPFFYVQESRGLSESPTECEGQEPLLRYKYNQWAYWDSFLSLTKENIIVESVIVSTA